MAPRYGLRFGSGAVIFGSYFLFFYNIMQTFFGKYHEEEAVETAVVE